MKYCVILFVLLCNSLAHLNRNCENKNNLTVNRYGRTVSEAHRMALKHLRE